MQTMTRRALSLAGLSLLVVTSAVWAQQAPTVRVRGEITKVEGNTLSVKSRTGEDLTVKLAEPLRVSAMVKSSLADIKEGTFIGVSAMPQPDGSQKAYGIHIFLEVAEGRRGRPVFGLGRPARQHNDQRQRRHDCGGQ